MFKIEYRAVIKFLTKEGLPPSEIKQRLNGVYGEASPSYTTVKEWAKQFRLGRESVEDEPREGRPVEVLTAENISRVEQEMLQDNRLKVKDLSERLHLSNTTVRRILHEHLRLNKHDGDAEKSIPKKVCKKKKRETKHFEGVTVKKRKTQKSAADSAANGDDKLNVAPLNKSNLNLEGSIEEDAV